MTNLKFTVLTPSRRLSEQELINARQILKEKLGGRAKSVIINNEIDRG